MCQRERADGELSGGLVGKISGAEARGISREAGEAGKAGEAGEVEAGGTSEVGLPLTQSCYFCLIFVSFLVSFSFSFSAEEDKNDASSFSRKCSFLSFTFVLLVLRIETLH
jgi:hypothetical protein